MRQEIEARLRLFIANSFLYRDEMTFGDDESLLAQGVLDSMGVLELIAYLEGTFQIQVADEELLPENLDTIRNLGAYVERKLTTRHVGGVHAH